MRQTFVTLMVVGAVTLLVPPTATANTIQVYLDRALWEAVAGGDVLTENFNGISVPPAIQLAAGVDQVGILKIDIQRLSGNLIEPGSFFDSVDGTNFWRIEAATQNGLTPPVTPILEFETPVTAFGADFNFFSTPRATMTIDGQTLTVSDYIPTARDGFLGIVSAAPFNSVKFDVVSPFNTLFHADNVSFTPVPEPPTLALLVAGALGLAAHTWRKRKRSLALVVESTLPSVDEADSQDADPAILSMPSRWTQSTRRAA